MRGIDEKNVATRVSAGDWGELPVSKRASDTHAKGCGGARRQSSMQGPDGRLIMHVCERQLGRSERRAGQSVEPEVGIRAMSYPNALAAASADANLQVTLIGGQRDVTVVLPCVVHLLRRVGRRLHRPHRGEVGAVSTVADVHHERIDVAAVHVVEEVQPTGVAVSGGRKDRRQKVCLGPDRLRGCLQVGYCNSINTARTWVTKQQTGKLTAYLQLPHSQQKGA